MIFTLERESVAVFTILGMAVASWVAIGVVYALIAFLMSFRRRPMMPERIGTETALVLVFAVLFWPFFVYEAIATFFARPKPRNGDKTR